MSDSGPQRRAGQWVEALYRSAARVAERGQTPSVSVVLADGERVSLRGCEAAGLELLELHPARADGEGEGRLLAVLVPIASVRKVEIGPRGSFEL
jgi:hypothetical protein